MTENRWEKLRYLGDKLEELHLGERQRLIEKTLSAHENIVDIQKKSMIEQTQNTEKLEN